MKTRVLFISLFAAAGTLSVFGLSPASVTPGDLLVYRVGADSGTDLMVNTGNAVSIDEWTTTGQYVRSFATGIFASGTATSEGMLNLSPDGQYAAYTGYASTAASSLSGTAVARTVGLLSAAGNVTGTNFTDFATGNNPRGAVTTNGTDLWMVGGAGGIRYSTTAGGSSVQLSTTVTNLRDVQVVGGQLYVSDNSGSSVRLGTVGSGTPKTTGQTITNLVNFPTSGSPYSFYFADLSSTVNGVDTLYIAEDTTGGGQIQKYSLEAGGWTAKGSAVAASIRGLSGTVNGSSVQLFGTTGSAGASGAGTIYTFTDTSGYDAAIGGAAATLVQNGALQAALGGAGNSYAFRGIVLVPVPEPATYAVIMGLAAIGVVGLRRRSTLR